MKAKRIDAQRSASVSESRKAYEAEVTERLNRTHAGASWHFVSRRSASGRTERLLVSVPKD